MRADQRKFHYIYKITRTDGLGKYYIGMHSTDDLEDGYFGSGKVLWHSINRHGKENHIKEILEYLPSREALKLRERHLVNEEILNDSLCMNLRLGGEGGGGFWSTSQRSAATIAGNKSSKRDHKTIMAKVIATRRERGNLTGHTNNGWTGKSHRVDSKIKMSEAASKRTGEKNSQYGTCWVTNGIKPIKIKKEKLGEYLTSGYSRGRT